MQHMPHLGTARLMFRDRRTIDKRATLLAVEEYPFCSRMRTVVSTEVYASGVLSGMAATSSLTSDSPRSQRIRMIRSSASVNVLEGFGGMSWR